jgi:hypothetical protein
MSWRVLYSLPNRAQLLGIANVPSALVCLLVADPADDGAVQLSFGVWFSNSTAELRKVGELQRMGALNIRTAVKIGRSGVYGPLMRTPSIAYQMKPSGMKQHTRGAQ